MKWDIHIQNSSKYSLIIDNDITIYDINQTVLFINFWSYFGMFARYGKKEYDYTNIANSWVGPWQLEFNRDIS